MADLFFCLPNQFDFAVTNLSERRPYLSLTTRVSHEHNHNIFVFIHISRENSLQSERVSQSVVMWFSIVVVCLAIYLWFKNRFTYWHKLGFPYAPASFPMGSMPTANISEPGCVAFEREYKKYKGKGPAFGIFGMAKPMLVPTDPQLLRDIYAKNFEIFHERGFNVSEEADPLSQNLSFKNGQEWKDLRAKLSPTFTSGKMKMMYPNIVRNADRMIDYLTPFAERVEPLEMKEVYCAFTTEVISDVAFGIESNCLGNPDNEFRKTAKRIFELNFTEMMKLMVMISFEKLGHLLKFGFNGKEVTEFIMRVVRETLEHREKNKIERNDFFQLLLNIRKNEGMSFNELAANSFVFFLAG
jgi:cytochrome P450 family 6